MITKPYLEYLDREFGVLSTGVKFAQTAEDAAKKNRESGFRPNAKAKDYSDQYRWKARRHPEFQEYRDWYSSGKKIWPSDIDLTPTVLKHWYCTDGSYDTSVRNNCILLCMLKEVENQDKVTAYFESQNLPTPSYITSQDSCVARFGNKESEVLWEYMGDPLPGFEYKWPEDSR